MLHEKAKRLKSLSITCEEDDEYVELANRFEHYIRRSDRQMHYNNNKELYLYLCEGFLCDNGQLWVSLCKSSNGICSMLPATQVLRDDIAYHHLYTLCLSESRFRMVRILGDESSYNFTCTLESQIFSPANMYACYLVFKFEDNKHPDDTLMFTTEYGLGHGLLGKVLVHMSEFSKNKPIVKPKTDDQDPRTKGLDTKHELQYDLECWMHPRKDGWIEAMLSKPLNRLQDHSTLEVRLIVLNGNFRGVIVEGIEFRPYV